MSIALLRALTGPSGNGCRPHRFPLGLDTASGYVGQRRRVLCPALRVGGRLELLLPSCLRFRKRAVIGVDAGLEFDVGKLPALRFLLPGTRKPGFNAQPFLAVAGRTRRITLRCGLLRASTLSLHQVGQ